MTKHGGKRAGSGRKKSAPNTVLSVTIKEALKGRLIARYGSRELTTIVKTFLQKLDGMEDTKNQVLVLQDQNSHKPFAVCENLKSARVLIEKSGAFIDYRRVTCVEYVRGEFLVKSVNPSKLHRGEYENIISVSVFGVV